MFTMLKGLNPGEVIFCTLSDWTYEYMSIKLDVAVEASYKPYFIMTSY